MTTTKTKTYKWTVRTDACLMTDIEAATADEAAAIFAESEELESRTLADLLAEIESIDGAWMWIESDDHPTFVREYAGEENMG